MSTIDDGIVRACQRALSHPFYSSSPAWATRLIDAVLSGEIVLDKYDAATINTRTRAIDAVATVLTNHAGRYTHAWLDTMVGPGKYRLRTVSIEDLDDDKTADQVDAWLDDPDLSFACCDEENITLLWLNEYPGWMLWTKRLGVTITPSTKTPKRCKIFTRLAFLFGHFDIDELNIGYVDDPTEFSVYSAEEVGGAEIAERFLDGANVISRELYNKLVDNGLDAWQRVTTEQAGRVHQINSFRKDWAKLRQQAIDEGMPLDPYMPVALSPAIDITENRGRIARGAAAVESVSLRVLMDGFQFKGEALVVPRAQIPGGHDLLLFRPNGKRETSYDRGVFILAEPVHSPGDVFTDEQTMSWLGPWLYPAQSLIDAMDEAGKSLAADLREGRYPDFYSKVSEVDDTISRFRRQALHWHEEGLGLSSSIYLQERIIDGYHKQLMAKERWPVPCAIYAHVGTDSWLAMAGYLVSPDTPDNEMPKGAVVSTTPEGSVWFHPESGRLIYNDRDFARLFKRHGGWDLDDAVKAHYRLVPNAATGELERKIVVVRCPNSWGEYAIMNHVEGEFVPTWKLVDGAEISWLGVGEGEPPKFLEELDITYSGLPKAPKPTHADYTKDFVRELIETAKKGRGVFGRHANAEMVYYESLRDYRRKQLDSVEAIIDACTQEQSQAALAAIDKDTKAILNELREAGVPVDRALWERRVGRFRADMRYGVLLYSRRKQLHDTLCTVFRNAMLAEAQKTVGNIPDEVLELGKAYLPAGRKLVSLFYEWVNRPGARDQNYYVAINDALVATLAQFPEHEAYQMVLAMARVCYTTPRAGRFADTALFQLGDGKGDSVFAMYLRALHFFGIGDDLWRTWVMCSECKSSLRYDDRYAYQQFLNSKRRCRNCC